MQFVYLFAALLLACLTSGDAFLAPRFGGSRAVATPVSISLTRNLQPQAPPLSSTALSAKNSKEKEAATSQYWQGDWVCADCGYIFDRDIDGGGKYFEEQVRGFICPQCSAPRKRYAKAVGDQWGVTRDGGDFPIYAWTFVGLVVTTYLALVVVPTL